MPDHHTAGVPGRRSVADAVEGFHLAALLHGLDELGVLDALRSPATAAEVAAATGTDAGLLDLCLAHLAGRTDAIEADSDRYRMTGAWDPLARSNVRQYVGAYGRGSVEVASVLREPALGPGLVDRERHARSYTAAPTVTGLVADLVTQLDLGPTLDLGCGPASMLVDLAHRDPDFTGWGVDGAAMCATARKRIADAGLADRVTIVDGDAFDPAGLDVGPVRSITATSLLNELWDHRTGRPSVAAWVAALAAAHPGRALVVCDYFGRLGVTPPPWPPLTAVHDLVQALSGQGVPPPGHDAWRHAYREAGADLLHVAEDGAGTFFVHLLRLPGPS